MQKEAGNCDFSTKKILESTRDTDLSNKQSVYLSINITYAKSIERKSKPFFDLDAIHH